MDRTDYRYNLEYRAVVRTQMLAVAERFLAGELSVIEAARELSQYHDLVEPELEPFVRAFVGINSETDALPVGDVRRLWSPEALQREDKKIADAERHWREWGVKAATRIVQLLKETPSS